MKNFKIKLLTLFTICLIVLTGCGEQIALDDLEKEIIGSCFSISIPLLSLTSDIEIREVDRDFNVITNNEYKKIINNSKNKYFKDTKQAYKKFKKILTIIENNKEELSSKFTNDYYKLISALILQYDKLKNTKFDVDNPKEYLDIINRLEQILDLILDQ